MHLLTLTNWSSTILALLASTTQISATTINTSQPPAPALQFLYTAYVECTNTVMESPGPHGIRKAIPIVGGNFTGPRLSGTILPLGADWSLTDPLTNLSNVDTRYNLRTHDGADIYIRTSGPKAPDGGVHLRLVFETGDQRYYWVNSILAVGVLHRVASTEETRTLRIDAWNFASDWNSTAFLE
ncbi:hypothetical protein BJY04DRAFT_224003 [Aspergillus karnatakaensis]|uniref:DUF3237 domain-containing protein n=1 Tax=Aspergillus karnatakaensis TaxID=1810916 RepID=UPI003CCD5C44